MSKSTEAIILSIVPTTLTPKISGFEKNAYGPLDALGKITKVVCVTDSKSDIKNHTFELKPLIKHHPLKYFSIKNYKLLLQEVKKLKPSCILLEQPFLGIIVYLISRKTKVPYFIHAHNIEYLRFKSLGRYLWLLLYINEKFTMQHAKGVFFVTEHDKDIAIKKLKLKNKNCFVSPYGVPHNKPIEISEERRNAIRGKHGIASDEIVFMFFGVLKYMPNIEALELIIQEILPRLTKKLTKKFKILICGAGISDDYKKQLEKIDPERFIYAGFVNNIDEYTQSADIILNPILSGGGIKTIIVEALSFNKTVISTQTGAIGVDAAICGNKLCIAEDKDWDDFTNKAIEAIDTKNNIPPEFFNVFSLTSITKNLFKELTL